MVNYLDRLPPELRLRMFEYVPRPSDLQTLCLTSKATNECALPTLYRKISLRSGSILLVPECDRGLLQIGNPGLAYVRKLVVIAAKGVAECEDEARFLGLFLSILPRDALRHM